MNKDDMTVRKSWNEFCDKNPKVCIETTKMIDTLFDVQGQSQYIYLGHSRFYNYEAK